jgi:hypothetical protein
METHRGSMYEIPPRVEDHGVIALVYPENPGVQQSVDLRVGEGLLDAWDAAERIIYPAAHITVTSD